MGIQGLLQFLKEASEPIHVQKFKGQTVAVDTYCWLHKGAFACAEKLAKGEPTDQYVAYCMKFVDMLLGCGVKPILVFDGCTLPSKKEVEKSRRERRETNLQKGKQLLREGKLSEARECFTRCVNVTPAMAHAVIKAARACRVDCIVAPYEADSQLAYLNKTGIAQAIITEDSDLLAFGCKKVILKMDKFGNGLEIDQSRLGMCKQLGEVFTEEKFRYMCILSGCDYLPSLHGIGLAKACKLLKIANNPDIIKVIKKIGQYLKMNITVPDDYITGFIRANNTFMYQLVFDPLKRKLVPLNPYADDTDPETLDYAGRNIGNQAAFQIAIGNKDINTMEQIDNYSPDTAQSSQPKSRRWSDSVADKNTMLYSSIWNRSFKPCQFNIHTSPTKTKEPEKQSTKGIEKVISIKGLKLPRKEPNPKRQREELSDVDLLSQYSFSKKAKKESCEENLTPQKLLDTAPAFHKSISSGNENVNSQHKVRNKFATLLQRKNEEHGTVVVPGTRSRFFCNSVSDCSVRNEIHKSPLSPTSNGRNVLEHQSPNKDLLNLAEENDVAQDTPSLLEKVSDIEVIKKEILDLPLPKGEEFKLQSPNNGKCGSQSLIEDNHGAPSLEEENCDSQSSNEGKCRRTILISPLGTPRSCFTWSSNLGRESTRTPISSPGLLALQQFHRETDGTKTPVFQSNKWTRLQEGSVEVRNSLATVPDTASTPKSVGEWSQTQMNTTKLSSKESISEDSDNDNTVFSDPTSPVFITNMAEKNHSAPRNKVPGLYKSKSVGSCSTTKVKPLLPAKVSGLSRKSRSALRKSLQNDENKPGLQATISGLWKQFGFKKEVSKISSKPSEPLSPVKDNLALTPETDDDIYHKLEYSCAQRSIF